MIPGLNFVAVDFETSNSNHASVCQIGVARILDGAVTKRATKFVLPPEGHREFGYYNIKTHGITASMVADAPGWEEFLPRLIKFAGDLPLVGHNVAVERSIIRKATAAIGEDEPYFEYLCTQKLATKLLPDAPSYKLNRLVEEFDLPAFQHHDAGEDAVAAANLVIHIAEQTGLNDVEELWAAASRN